MNLKEDKMYRRLFFLLLVGTLSVGCQTFHHQTLNIDIDKILLESNFAGFEDVDVESPEQIFALDAPATDFIAERLLPIDDQSERMKTLVRYIFERTDFNLLYKSSANTVASETFTNRAANCLSLTIMTHALANSAGLNVDFQEIIIPEYWTRQNGYSVLNGHVNLKFSRRAKPGKFSIANPSIEVDFDPLSPKEHFPANKISKQRVVGMFYNNKAAEALVEKQYVTAFAYLRASLMADQSFVSSWNNLGILYRMTGHYDQAEKTYKTAILIDEDYLQLQENLALLYQTRGREIEYQALISNVEDKRRSNTYYYFNLGQQANDKGEYREAINHFFEAVALDDDKHEFYFGLATAYAEVGDINNTKRFLRKAERVVKFDDWKNHYRSKLSLLSKS
jgi:tetratricopeptide (TPR) repeat protein